MTNTKNNAVESKDAIHEAGNLRFTRKKAVTLPSISFKGIETLFVKFLKPMVELEALPIKGESDSDGNQKFEKAAHGVHVVNLETGEERILLCNALLIGELEKMKADDYVGKTFEITQKPVENKKYKSVSIYEINVED